MARNEYACRARWRPSRAQPVKTIADGGLGHGAAAASTDLREEVTANDAANQGEEAGEHDAGAQREGPVVRLVPHEEAEGDERAEDGDPNDAHAERAYLYRCDGHERL